jgi:hypothetical protein
VKAVGLPGVAGDLQALPRRLREIAIGKITAVCRGELRGQPLAKQVRTGDLSDCRKVYFDDRGDRPPAWRIVYRERSDGSVEIIEVVAVGARAESAVYLTAGQRLGRTEGDA